MLTAPLNTRAPPSRRALPEIHAMGAWPGVLLALLSGAAAAGVAFYVIGRRVERRVAEAAVRATAAEGERLLEEAKQRVVLAAKEELLQAREAWEPEATRRRHELARRGGARGEPGGGRGVRAAG